MAQDRHNDSLALVTLYNATDGANWTNTWDLTQPMDDWYGVTLDENGRVNELLIPNNQLSGTIPPEIGNLTDLVLLDLYDNQLTDTIPSEIGNLTHLQRLWASSNQLTGNIPPEIGNLNNLRTLYLYSNQLSGNIPVEMTTFATNLRWVYLGNNQLSGTIPPEIGNMTNLVDLGLENNQLTGNIPPEIGNMANLKGINLSGNQIVGNIPPAIGNMYELLALNLSANQLAGNIPPEIGNLDNLSTLSLRQNQLVGSIPPEVWNLSNLRFLRLSDNQLTGNIPPEIENLVNLHTLDIHYNELTGNIPSEITNLNYLTNLYLSHNQLNGCYDDSLLNLCSLSLSNTKISDGNEFVTTWGDFCNTAEGACSTYTLCDTSLTINPPGNNLATLVNTSPEGTCFFLPNGNYNFGNVYPKNNMKFVGESRSGVQIDGNGFENAFYGVSSNVEIKNMTFCNFNNDAGIDLLQEQSPIRGSNNIWANEGEPLANGWVIDNIESHSNIAAGIFLGHNFTVTNSIFRDNGVVGIGGDDFLGGYIFNNTIYGNGEDQAGGYGGGIKISKCGSAANPVVIEQNEVYNNTRAGIWGVMGCHGFHVINNYVHDHETHGILYEISDNAYIADNTLVDNAVGWSGLPGNWSRGGITVAESKDVLVENNTLTNSRGGIVTRQTYRPSSSFEETYFALFDDLTLVCSNITIQNNTINGASETGIGNSGSGLGQLDNNSNINYICNTYDNPNDMTFYWMDGEEYTYTQWQAAGIHHCGACPDNDNDGVCSPDDVCPNLDNNLIGQSCDDGNPNTTNDVYGSDCICMGTPIPTGQGICHVLTPPTIDGVNNEWSQTTYTLSNVLSGTVNSQSDLFADFHIQWDNNYLYVFGNVQDDNLINDSAAAYQDDGLEVYIDGGNEQVTTYDANDHQLMFRVNDNDVHHWSGGQVNPAGVTFAQTTTDTGYAMEIRIAWSFIGVSPVDGMPVGIDIHVNDDDDGSDRDKKMSWNAPTDQAWNNPSLFNTMTLLSFCMVQDRRNDSLALVAFHDATDGANWINTWDLAQPMDTWHGVTLNENGRVTRLHIPENELSGTIPPELGNLSELKELYLYNNILIGNLPDEIGNLTNIEWFSVYKNFLSGTVPASFSNLNKLKNLSFSRNEFEGNVFDIIINFQDLEFFHVSRNQFTGSIPQSISSLTKLKEMSLYSNDFDGYLPSELGDLQQLTLITLGENQFTGCYPDSISNFCSFSEWTDNMYMSSGNNFAADWEDFCDTGAGSYSSNTCIPCRQSDSLALVALYEATNGASWTDTWDLFLPIRDWYGISLDSSGCVTYIDMDGNNLQGTIPYQIGDLGSLTKLYLSNNQIIGNIPSEIGHLDELTNLLLSGNQIFGNIPDEIGNLTELKVLDLHGNQLNGNIPDEIGNLSNLQTFNVSGNELEGNIPSEIGNLNNLTQLKLFDNQLTDTIPPGMVNLTNLDLIYLQNNYLTGNISLFDTLNNLTDLRLSGNLFTGEIPDFSVLSDLETLHLQENKFSHEDIATNFNSNDTISDFLYSPQYYGNEQFHTDTVGATVILSSDPAIHYENPSVIWLQNDLYKTSEYILHDTTYTIASLDTVDIGVYQYHFIDSTLTPLVDFHSLPINNYVEGLDLSGNPVIPGQLIIEYRNNAPQDEIDSIRTQLEDKYNGSLIDSCGCSVSLDLWAFDSNDIDAVRHILGLHSRTERNDESADLDGGHDVGLNSKTQQGNQSVDECGMYIPDYENGEQILIQAYDTILPGTDAVVIAVTDSGMPMHANHIWVNEAEQNGIEGEDDDNNGYIDDTLNINFTNDTINGNHGKAVISRIVNNIPENMNIEVMSIKTFDGQGIGTLFDLLCGIYYAVDNGADIVNISAGYAGDESTVFKNALKFGRDKDVLFVVSAGNGTLNLDTIDYWPPAFARDSSLINTIIATAEVDDDYEIAPHSNVGDSTVTVAAPGKVYTEDGCVMGTSFSAPLVALGVAMEKTFDANQNHIIVRNNFIQKMDTSPDLDTLVKDGRVLRVSIKSGECEQVQNGDFSDGQTGWSHWGCNITNMNNGLEIDIPSVGQNSWNVALVQQRPRYEYGKQYHVSFKAKSDANRSIIVTPGHRDPPYTNYGYRRIYLTTTLQTYEFVFTMNEPTDPNGSLEFNLGESDVNLFITDISVNKVSCAEDFPINCEQVKNGDLIGWELNGCTGTSTDNGLEIDIPAIGQNIWDVRLAKQGFFYEQGKQYRLMFKARSDANRDIRVKAALRAAPHTGYDSSAPLLLTTTLQTYEFVFTMNHPTDLNGFLEFYLGESDVNLFITDISFMEIGCVELREGLSNTIISKYLVFPNPTSGILNVSFDLPNNYDTGLIRLFDINGKLLLEHREAMFTQNQFQLDLNNIPTGVYFLRINVGEYMLTHKVIKSHR